MQLGRTLAGPTDALPDGWHGVEQRLEEPAVVDVRDGDAVLLQSGREGLDRWTPERGATG